jgi:NADH:ubiquinone reductase (H+-translocating)
MRERRPENRAPALGDIVVAGAGYAGLHVALRLTAKLRNNPGVDLTLVDRHDYHQVLTELPRVAGGTNDFSIPGLAQRALSLYPTSDAERVWAAVMTALTAAAAATDSERQRCLATVVVGGSGATGVELAGELAEMLPAEASRRGLAPDRPAVWLVEASPTILAGSSPQLINKASRILSDLGVQVRTNAAIAAATEEGFRLKDGQLVEGGVFVWAGGVKAPELVADSGLPTGHNGRVKVDRYLRVLDHPEIYVAGDLASVVDPRSGHVLPSLAQVALEEGETTAGNLDAELTGRTLEAFTFHDKGFVVSVGARRGVADIAGITSGGQLAPPAQRRHRVGVPPIRQPPARLGPSSPVNAKRLGGTGSNHVCSRLRLCGRTGADTHSQPV